jgi:hypothetical protein
MTRIKVRDLGVKIKKEPGVNDPLAQLSNLPLKA